MGITFDAAKPWQSSFWKIKYERYVVNVWFSSVFKKRKVILKFVYAIRMEKNVVKKKKKNIAIIFKIFFFYLKLNIEQKSKMHFVLAKYNSTI